MHNLSMRTKLVVFSAVLCLLTAFLCTTGFIVYDMGAMRTAHQTRLRSIAEMVAFNGSAVIAFQDKAAAKELLQGLSQQTDIEFAAIHTGAGSELAVYDKQKQATQKDMLSSKDSWSLSDGKQWNGNLVAKQPVREGELISGYVSLIANQDSLDKQTWTLARLGLLVLILSVPLSFVLSQLSEGIITRPILTLAESARRVTDGDYSMRVDSDRRDEIGVLCLAFNEMLKRIEFSERMLQDVNEDLTQQNAQLADQRNVASRACDEAESANNELKDEIQRREEIEKEREELHGQLMVASRQAGKAEIATGVLHNVGNVMNSVNVSAGMLRGSVEQRLETQIQAAITLMGQYEDNLSQFFEQDERSQHFLPFLRELRTEAKSAVEMIDELQQNIELVNSVVASQQSFATTAGMISTCELPDVVDGAIQITKETLGNHAVEIVRDYNHVAAVDVDKQRLIQIIVNLIRNAKHAILDAETEERRINVRISSECDDSVVIEVADTGVGITSENIDRIFEHGFSTRKEKGGHGFGLHHSFCAAREMGGSITVNSPGAGRGATFCIHLPINGSIVS